MHMKYQHGYINPSTRRKKIGDASLTTKVAPEDKEKVEELCHMLGTNTSEWLRNLTIQELQKFNLVPVLGIEQVDQRFTSAITYTSKRIGFLETIKAFINFLEAQKNPEVRVQDLFAQHPKGN